MNMTKRYADGGVTASSSPTDAFSQIQSQNSQTSPATSTLLPAGQTTVLQSSNPQITPPPANVGMVAAPSPPTAFRKGGKATKKPMKKFAKGGTVSSASKRGDGCATKGKTRGTMR